MFVTDTQLLSFQRCQRQTFLDIYGDRHEQDPKSDFLLKLIRDNSVFESSVLENYSYQQPDYPRGDWAAGAAATFTLMQQQVEIIYRGVLREKVSGLLPEEDVNLVSRPRLLIKQPGDSVLGDWTYVPADIKLSKRPKLDYQLITAFHARILAALLGRWPDAGWLFMRKKGFFAVNLELRLPQMEEMLFELIEMLQNRAEPEVFISRQKCNICTWYSSCHAIASNRKHLSLLPGVTPSRHAILKELNLTTVESLANAFSEQLAIYPEFAEGIAEQVILQAKSSVENRPIFSRELTIKNWQFKKVVSSSYSLSHLSSFPPQSRFYIPRSPVELYFDIEAQPEMNLDYLHGVLVIDRRSKTEKFHVMLAENSSDEESIWEEFLKLVWQYPIAPIYHFCDYEVMTIKRLAKVYKTPFYKWRPLVNRCVDIHKLVKETVTLPVEGYALKHIARWIGFEWRDKNANGAQSVCWYEDWLKTGDRSLLDAIVRYNEDDCYATYYVKEWLSNFLDEAAS